MTGWKQCTENIREFSDLPVAAQKYVQKIEELLQVPGTPIHHPKQLNSLE